MYATKSYELTAVAFLGWIVSWTAFKVGLAVVVAARSWGIGDKPTNNVASTDIESAVTATFGIEVRVILIVSFYLQAYSQAV